MHPTHHLFLELDQHRTSIAVIGLGYVGLPLALCMARRFRVVGFDVQPSKITALCEGRDPVGECGDAAVTEAIQRGSFVPASDPACLRDCRFVIVAVPTPVDDAKRPDFRPLIAASETVGQHLADGAVIVYESTVYPGATEEVCIPIVERVSGRRAGIDFAYGYSPERINPGDREHTVDKIRKVVSGMDAETLECVAAVYGAAIPAGVFRATSVRVAEAAKVIENTQRDLNIALINELALIFHRLGLDTSEVLEAAGTKWNFLPFRPGLVGGHCIGVDPYYLTYKAQQIGYHPAVILAGRRINDAMGHHVAERTLRLMVQRGINPHGARALVLGLTFKENCPDIRNTRVIDIVQTLRAWCVEVDVLDPLADPEEARHEYGIELISEPKPASYDAVVLAVAHRTFAERGAATIRAWLKPKGVLFDVKSLLPKASVDDRL